MKRKISELSDEEFIEAIAMAARINIVKRLLKGNDTQCFTTEQYRELYEEVRWKPLDPARPITSDQLWFHIKPRDHLLSLSHMIVEVHPNIWTTKENFDRIKGASDETTKMDV